MARNGIVHLKERDIAISEDIYNSILNYQGEGTVPISPESIMKIFEIIQQCATEGKQVTDLSEYNWCLDTKQKWEFFLASKGIPRSLLGIVLPRQMSRAGKNGTPPNPPG